MEKVFTDQISTKVFLIIVAIGFLSLLPMFLTLQAKDYGYILYVAVFVIGLAGLLVFLKIKIQFSAVGLQYSFSPFVNNKIINFDEIKHTTIENASFWKYGGIGIRMVGNGTAYVLGNEKNLCISLQNGKNIILSFKAADEEAIIKLLLESNISLK